LTVSYKVKIHLAHNPTIREGETHISTCWKEQEVRSPSSAPSWLCDPESALSPLCTCLLFLIYKPEIIIITATIVRVVSKLKYDSDWT